MANRVELIKDELLIEKLETLINHGVSVTTISENTGINPEEIANYICSVWKNKSQANIDKMNKVAFLSGSTIPISESNCMMLVKTKKRSIMS